MLPLMRFVGGVFLLGALVVPAAAEEPALVLGAGGDRHRPSQHQSYNTKVRNSAAELSAEYRSDRDLLRGVKPVARASASSDRQAYAHAGLYRDFALSSRWILSAHISAGLYGRGTKNDLGGALEFQTGLDLFYRLEGGARIGVTARHVSNAGSGDFNPGSETIALLYARPLR